MVSIIRNRALEADAKKASKPEKRSASSRMRSGKREQAEIPKKRKTGRHAFVLFVGDEGAILTYVTGKNVQRRLYAPAPNQEQTENMRALLDSDARAPIYLLLDSMDQSYQRHSLPPVASVSLNKIVRRRLDRDFGVDDIKGALRIGREEGGRRDWNYLLVAVSTTGAVMEWLDLLLSRENPFMGIYLSPVESESFIARLTKSFGKPESEAETPEDSKKTKRTKNEESAYPWQLMISHHKVGGFRLVVLHKGVLAFTRLAQPIGETTPEVVAGNVEQEVLNTVEYMKRLGYQETQPLQVITMVASDIKASLDRNNIPAQDVHFLTPYEAAELVGLEGVAQPEDHYADVLHSVFMLSSKKHRLVLHSPITSKLKGLRASSQGMRALGFVVALGLIGYGVFQGYQGFGLSSEISTLESQLKMARDDAAKDEEKMKQFPENIQSMLDVMRLYQAYGTQQKFFLQPALEKASNIPLSEIRFSEVKWSRAVTANNPETMQLTPARGTDSG